MIKHEVYWFVGIIGAKSCSKATNVTLLCLGLDTKSKYKYSYIYKPVNLVEFLYLTLAAAKMRRSCKTQGVMSRSRSELQKQRQPQIVLADASLAGLNVSEIPSLHSHFSLKTHPKCLCRMGQALCCFSDWL